MPDRRSLHPLIEDTATYSGKDEIDIDQYRSLRRALHADVLDVIGAERSFFVLGSYDAAEKARLRESRDRLSRYGHAFLLEDTLEAWEF